MYPVYIFEPYALIIKEIVLHGVVVGVAYGTLAFLNSRSKFSATIQGDKMKSSIHTLMLEIL
jgi:hypothetical protein